MSDHDYYSNIYSKPLIWIVVQLFTITPLIRIAIDLLPKIPSNLVYIKPLMALFGLGYLATGSYGRIAIKNVEIFFSKDPFLSLLIKNKKQQQL